MNKFIDALRAEIERHRQHCLATIVTGTLDVERYRYSCGYLKALDDIAKLRIAGDTPSDLGMIEQVLSDLRKE